MKKRTKRLLYALIVVVLIMFVQQYYTANNLTFGFSTNPLKEKKALLKQLHQQHALLKSTAQETFVLDTIRPLSNNRLTLSAKATIEAGIDLRLLNEADMIIEGDSIAIQLPPAEILTVTINPSGFTTIKQTGNWNNTDVLQLKAKAQAIITHKTMSSSFISYTEQRSRAILDQFLQSIGFKKISLL